MPAANYIRAVFIVALNASATQWYYSLTSPPAGWEVSPEWSFSGNGAAVDFYEIAEYGQSFSWEGNIISEPFAIPESVEELEVEFDHEWLCSGSGSEYSDYQARVRVYYSINWQTPVLLLHYYAGNYIGYYNSSGSEHFTATLPISPGDSTIRFLYNGSLHVSCWGASTTTAIGHLEWEISDFLLTVFDGQELQPSTWASLKRIFE